MTLKNAKFANSKLNDEEVRKLRGYVKTFKQKKDFREKLRISQQTEITWFKTGLFPAYCKLYLDLMDMKENCKLIPRVNFLMREMARVLNTVIQR